MYDCRARDGRRQLSLIRVLTLQRAGLIDQLPFRALPNWLRLACTQFIFKRFAKSDISLERRAQRRRAVSIAL